MAEELLEKIVNSDIQGDFMPWFLEFFKDNERNNCSLEEFAVFFLNFLRNQTEGFIKKNTKSSCNTPPVVTSVTDQLNSASNTSQPIKPSTTDSFNVSASSISMSPFMKKSKPSEPLYSKQENAKIAGRTRNATDDCNQKHSQSLHLSSDFEHSPVKLLNRNDSFHFTSTPTSHKENRRSFNEPSKSENIFSNQSTQRNSTSDNQSMKKFNRSFTENSGSNTKNKSSGDKGKSPARQSLCLGDFLVSSAPVKQKRRSVKDTPSSSNESPSSKSPSVSLNDSGKTKPKRRVVPTPINSSSSNTFTSPAARNENNILKIAEDEVHDSESCIILKEREVLKNELTNIVKEFQEVTSLRQPTLQSVLQGKLPSAESTCKTLASSSSTVDLSVVTNKTALDRLIEIHSALIDLNLTTNILGEISYLLNLLNAEDELSISQMKSTSSVGMVMKDSKIQIVAKSKSIKLDDDRHDGNNDDDIQTQIDPCLINKSNNELYTIFKQLSNCIYFTLGVLTKQKYLLALLDVTTLRVILDNERLENLNESLKEFLTRIYTHKIQLDSTNSGHEISFRIGCNFTNVSYQQDNDTKNNFPSSKEFNAFNKQRDMFYTILRTWEDKHLNHTWNFTRELEPKIRELFDYMEHPINMAHLAKLFTSQLIISSNFSESPTVSEIASLNVDRNKLSKLCQRLVAPSNFSTDYQFPGNEIFFKEFLMVTNSIIFLEQVKIAIVAELMEMNDSSFEIIKLESKIDNEKSGVESRYNEYVVRPETISTMRMLAKFLGLVMSRPFIYDECKNAVVDNRQIELRNMLQPTFDVMSILKKATIERKLIITLPWVVQYLLMLDHITLRLTYYRQLTQLLYELYINLRINTGNYSNSNISRNNSNIGSLSNVTELLRMRPTSIFILRLCLSWLFEHHPNQADDYYSYRKNMKTILEFNDERTFMKAIKSISNDRKIAEDDNNKSLWQCENLTNEFVLQELSFDPLLEGILNVACPFLADFRVSIMPTKFSKCPSRTGRYRHITTRMSSSETATTPTTSTVATTSADAGGFVSSPNDGRSSDTQTKLIEAFLHSQSLSMRRTVEFVIERTTSAVIKDYQMEVLLPSKTDAMNKVAQISSTKREEVRNQMCTIFTEAYQQAMQIWKDKIPVMIETRVKKSLEGLLPNETMDIVRRTCTSLIIEKCKLKIENWKISNPIGLDFYSKSIANDAEKFLKSNTITESTTETDEICKQQPYTTQLTIDITKGYPSKVFDQLQYWLHFTVSRPEFVTETALENFCIEFLNCLESQKLPTSIYKVSGLMTIALVQNLIRRHEDVLTKSLMKKFIDIWLCDRIRNFTRIPEKTNHSPTDEQKSPSEEDENAIKSSTKDSNIFDSLITKYFIQSLGNKASSFELLSQLLIAMVNVNLMTVDYLNELFVALFKEDWSQDVFKQISNVLDNVRGNTSQNSQDDDKSQLFMEMLADFARDLDDFQ